MDDVVIHAVDLVHEALVEEHHHRDEIVEIENAKNAEVAIELDLHVVRAVEVNLQARLEEAQAEVLIVALSVNRSHDPNQSPNRDSLSSLVTDLICE